MDAQLEKALGSIRLRKDVFSLLAMVKNENVNGRFDATIHEADLCLLYSRDLFKARIIPGDSSRHVSSRAIAQGM